MPKSYGGAPTMTFNPEISWVQHAKSVDTKTIHLQDVLRDIQGGRYKAEVEKIRNSLNSATNEAAELKERLPGIMFSGLFSKRSAKGLKAKSGLICADLDKVENIEAVRVKIQRDPHTLAVFVSPSGTGLKVLLRIDPEREHLESFTATERYFLKTFEVKIDPFCKDVCRLCFVSYDPKLFLNLEAKKLNYEEMAEVSMPENFGGRTRQDVTDLLTKIEPRPDYPTWIKIISAVYSELEYEDALAVLKNWSPEEVPGEYAEKYRSRLDHVGVGTLVYLASEARNTGKPDETLAKPFAVWSPGQFARYVADPNANLLGEGFLQKGELMSFVGAGGLGKTRLITYLAIQHIKQRPWCGLETKGGPIKWLLLSTESGLRRWKEDLQVMLQSATTDEANLIEKNFRALAITAEDDCDLNLGVETNLRRLKLTLAEENPGVVVFDPFADMIDGDENVAQDVGRSLRTLRKILHTHAPRAAYILVHHARTGAANVAQAGDNFNSGNFARGSKALYSKVRCEIQLAPADRDNPNVLLLCCGKSNDCKKFETRGIIFDPEKFSYAVNDDFDLQNWRADVSGKRTECIIPIAEVAATVRELVTANSGCEVSTAAITTALNERNSCSAKTVIRRLHAAVKIGVLRIGSKKSMWICVETNLGTCPETCPQVMSQGLETLDIPLMRGCPVPQIQK